MSKYLEAPLRDIIIYPDNLDPNNYYCVLLENGKAVEYLCSAETPDQENEKYIWKEQDIILTKISRIVPSLECAFVDLGQKYEGLLPLRLAPDNVKAGQLQIVQVRRLTAAGKGCQLTAKPQLPGFYAVYRPFEKRHLKRSKLYLQPEQQRNQIFSAELDNLADMWYSLQAEKNEGGKLPRLLARFQDPLEQALRDWAGGNLRSIQVEGMDLFSKVELLLEKHPGDWKNVMRIHPVNSGFGLKDVHRLNDLRETTEKKRIWLKNGGIIVFDQTEALLVIDVNSGKAVTRKNKRQTLLETNMLAAEEIARQLRLRKYQGIVIIDFIRLAEKEDQEKLLVFFNNILDHDNARLQKGGFTGLGLYELTRSLKK